MAILPNRGFDVPDTTLHHAIGLGLYTVPQAARLTRIAPKRIHGWIGGYGGRSVGKRRPIILRQIPVVAGQPQLGFLDLIEVRFVNWLIGVGVSWKTIRTAADRGRMALDHDHPFALARFLTDGKAIFLETQQETGDSKLLDLIKNNFAMYEVLEQSFRRGIAFTAEGVASKWHPDEGGGRVVLDPQRSFGQPIDQDSGVPTSVLMDAYRAEGSFDRVASWFEVSVEAVRQAVTYEMKLAA